MLASDSNFSIFSRIWPRSRQRAWARTQTRCGTGPRRRFQYEQRLDHAGMIAAFNTELKRQGLYKQVCANCHSTHDQPGSLPTSLRFATGKFRRVSDPGHVPDADGYGMMVPQSWMVPHPDLRCGPLHPRNISNIGPVAVCAADKAYLAAAAGETRAEPSNRALDRQITARI